MADCSKQTINAYVSSRRIIVVDDMYTWIDNYVAIFIGKYF